MLFINRSTYRQVNITFVVGANALWMTFYVCIREMKMSPKTEFVYEMRDLCQVLT